MLAPAMNLERDGAAMVRGYLDEEPLRRIVDIIEIAFAYLVSGQGDQTVRELWGSVGVVTLPSLNGCGRTSTRAFFAAGMGSQPAAWSFISSRRPLQHPPHVPEVDPSRMAHGLRRRRHERLRSVLHHLASAHGGRDKSTLSRDRAWVASAYARSSVSVAAQRTVSRRVGRQIFCARRPRHARARAR